jgi:hypothetical protein
MKYKLSESMKQAISMKKSKAFYEGKTIYILLHEDRNKIFVKEISEAVNGWDNYLLLHKDKNKIVVKNKNESDNNKLLEDITDPSKGEFYSLLCYRGEDLTLEQAVVAKCHRCAYQYKKSGQGEGCRSHSCPLYGQVVKRRITIFSQESNV